MFKGRKNKGFALIKLIVTVVVLGILVAIIVPSLIGYIDRAKNGTAISEAKSAVAASNVLIAKDVGDNGKQVTVTKYNSNKYDYDNILKSSKLEEKGAKIEKFSIKENTQISDMVYKASNGIVVEYKNGVYSILNWTNSE